MWLLWALLAWGPARADDACQELSTPPDSLQVAWVSRTRKRVRARSTLSVLRVADLRAFIQQGADATRVLQAIGLEGRRGSPRHGYKITLFDVQADWLCRPVEYALEGEQVAGLPACPQGRQVGTRRETGCGYTRDRAKGERGLDVYRILWRDAARAGFCVLPLGRFVEGA